MLRVVAAADTTCSSVVLALLIPSALLLSRPRALSTNSDDSGLLGLPRIGGREGAGGVKRPERECLSGDDLGDTVQDGWVGGDTVQPPVFGPGGEVPQAELELEQELVRRR